MLLLLILGDAVLDYGSGWLMGTTSHLLLLDFRSRLFERVHQTPLIRSQELSRGDTVNLSENDVHAIVAFMVGSLMELLPSFITFFGALWMIATISPTIGFLALVSIPPFVIATRLLGRRLRPISERLYARHGESSQLEENLGLLQLIKSRNMEAAELRRYRATSSAIFKENSAYLRIDLALTPVTRVAGAAGLIVALLFSAMIDSAHNVSELVRLFMYAGVLFGPISGIVSAYGGLQTTLASVDRLEPLFSAAPEDPQEGKAHAFRRAPGVRIEALRFGYTASAPVLKNLALEVDAGDFVVLTGPNGSGKSTLAMLLNRFAEPEAGRILFDDFDIAAARRADVRGAIGLVYQGMPLLDRSISANLNYGAEAPVDPDTLAETGLPDFVSTLEGGLAFQVGPGGTMLSGGQRQRVALAAALLQPRPLLLLDEATSMLDEPCQRRVRAHIAALTNRTRIVIDHDPGAWPGARVITLANGRMTP